MMYRIMAVALLMSPSSAWGQLFVRRPLQLMELSEHASVHPGWQDCNGQALRCGEIEASLPTSTAHVASITAVPLKNGPHTLAWDPVIWCSSAPGSMRVHTCETGPEGRMVWQLAGSLRRGQSAKPGLYRGAAILTIESHGESWSVRVPVSLEVLERQAACTLSGGGHLDFGRTEGLRAASITLDPVRAVRSWPDRSRSPMMYAFAHITLRSPADHVTVTVRAPAVLTAGRASVGFTSLLAYRQGESGPWGLLLTGSGTRTLTNTPDRPLRFRLGGRVNTAPDSPEARYSGEVTVSIHCGPGV